MSFRFTRMMAVLLLTAAAAPADSVRTLDGKIIDGVVKIDPKGGLLIAPRNAAGAVHVDFAQLLRARLDSGSPSDTGPGENWIGSDIGVVTQPGSSRFANGQLTLDASGADIKGTTDSYRQASQTLTGNGEIVARLVPSSQSKPTMIAGVMLRTSSDSNAAHAAILVARDGGLQFVARSKDGADTRVIGVAADRPPIWLRLVRQEQTIAAFKSPDGKTWSRLGETTIDMGADLLAGVVAASRDPASLSAAVFEKARVSPDVPPGSTQTPLNELTPIVTRLKKDKDKSLANLVRLNGQDIQRGLIDNTSCEIRYAIQGKQNALIGSIGVIDRENAGGAVTFQIFADNDKLFDSGKFIGTMPAQPISLHIAGRKELRLVVIDSGDSKRFNAAEFRNMRLVKYSAIRPEVKTQTASIVTVQGSVYSGAELGSVSADTVWFSRGERRDLSLPSTQVARIYLPGLTQQAIDHLPNSTGVLMINGDFYEGDIDRFADGKLQVNSVIFGPREFVLRRDVAAVVLHVAAPDVKTSDYVVQTSDGSIFMADAMAGDGAKLTVTDHALGKIQVDLRSVREIRYGGDRLKWLADLRPRRVDTDSGRSSADAFFIDSTIFGPTLDLTGVNCDRGVSMAAGTSVTYDLDGQYKTLLCVAGVPADMLPYASAVFVAEADGKELFRSPPRNSAQDALPVSIDTSGLKTITLRVESDKSSSLPVVGLWGDPLLVKTAP